MNAVIIEDEALTASDLAATITAVQPGVTVTAILSSVREAVTWFAVNPAPDIIFSDIQLGDGLSFAIFEAAQVNAPVIFCTAYDVYALQAFKAAGIDYILKPFTAASIAAAFKKYHQLKALLTKPVVSYNSIQQAFTSSQAHSLLVHYKDKIIPIPLTDVALFYLHNNLTHIRTFGKAVYFINETLKEAEKLAGPDFYRVNRQVLIQRRAVQDVSKYFGRKLLVNLSIPFEEKITVSKLKCLHFLSWLSTR